MKRLLMLLLVLLLCVPAATADTGVAYIDGLTSDRVHLRAQPSTESESLGLYYTGTDVIVIELLGDWSWVMVGDESGYIMTKYLTEEQPVRWGPWVVVNNQSSTWVNLRMSPSMDGMVVMCLENGTEMQILGETKDGWSYVDCDGVMGYIVSGMLLERRLTAEELLQAIYLAEDGAGSCRSILRFTAPNGQEIFFTASTKQPVITLEDVNFDGWDDIVVLLTPGAKNAYHTFFVYDEEYGDYCRTDGSDDAGLANYQLYPQYGVVSTYANGGNAGLLHVRHLYRWEGNELLLIRSAVSDEWTENFFEGQTYTSIIHGDTLHITVRDHTNANEESVLWELIIPKEDTDYRDVFNEETEALWQGIR